MTPECREGAEKNKPDGHTRFSAVFSNESRLYPWLGFCGG
jgi:hypothetical protein